ncbi:unnamed protein product, partial [Owenia fusiformis]
LQFCLVVSLCTSSVLYLLGPFVETVPELCKVIAILIHYAYLVTFMWMGVIAYDMYRTFSVSVQISTRGQKQLVRYCVFALTLPATIVAVALIMDSVGDDGSFKPKYGAYVCQITNHKANLLFFAGPLACVILFNIVMFTMTIIALIKSWKQSNLARNDDGYHFDVYFKLFVIMGFTWIFGFIGPFVHEAFMYVFIVLNASQGVFLSVVSVCTKQVIGELTNCNFSKRSYQSGQNTELTKI